MGPGTGGLWHCGHPPWGADRKSQSVKVLQCILWRRTKTEGGFVEWAVVFWL